MKLCRSADGLTLIAIPALASALVAVLMHSPEAQAIPVGMTEKQYLEVLKARDANISQPSLGVINPDGTVESVGQMQGSDINALPSPKLSDVDYSSIEQATNEHIQEQTQQQIDALRIKNEAEASQLQLNPNAYMPTPTFDDTHDFNSPKHTQAIQQTAFGLARETYQKM